MRTLKTSISMKKYQNDYYKKYPWKKVLVGIKQRCNNSNDTNYKWYGLLGIRCLIIPEECKIEDELS